MKLLASSCLYIFIYSAYESFFVVVFMLFLHVHFVKLLNRTNCLKKYCYAEGFWLFFACLFQKWRYFCFLKKGSTWYTNVDSVDTHGFDFLNTPAFVSCLFVSFFSSTCVSIGISHPPKIQIKKEKRISTCSMKSSQKVKIFVAGKSGCLINIWYILIGCI